MKGEIAEFTVHREKCEYTNIFKKKREGRDRLINENCPKQA